MGNSNTTLSKSDLLKAQRVPPNQDEEKVFRRVKLGYGEEEEKDFQLGNLDDTRLKQFATKLGVNVESCQNREELLECLDLVLGTDFWRTNAALHPNYSRVKNWLWVHQRYREQMKAIQDLYPSNGILWDTPLLEKLKTSFETFHGKIEKHSQFEDNQLFAFFKDHLSAECAGLLDKLQIQHEDLSFVQEVRQCFESCGKEMNAEKCQELQNAVSKYIEDLLKHLEFEERTLIHLWLNLSAEQYGTYRNYLSFQYSFMY